MVKKSLQHGGVGKRTAANGAGNRGHKKGQGALSAGSAIKHSNSSSKVGRTAPSGETRVRKDGSHFRSENTIRRLKMYKAKGELSKEQASGPRRIQPDRRWFGNTRVIAQGKMQAFRQTVSKGVEDPFSVVLKSSKLPMSLLRDTEGKASKMDLLSIQPFQETFGKRRQQKRAKLGSYDMDALISSVEKKSDEYDDKQLQRSKTGDAADGVMGHDKEEIFDKGTSKRIWRELWKVVDSSDVLVFVLDARDPMGTRCKALENELRKNRAHKHIVLVLNKVDLVPTWVSRRWIQVLMKEYPTLAFHASVTNPFGKNALLNLLRQFSTLMSEKKHVTVGMIGYPNVGKSAVINTLKRKKVCQSACVPGMTRVWQYIALTKRIYMLDCPGIVPPTISDFKEDSAKVLKGVVRAERIKVPSDYIDEVLSRVKHKYLIQKYKLSPDTTWEDAEGFLSIVGQKMGKLKKGGEAEIDSVARIVLNDWQRGKIPYFTMPPDCEGFDGAATASTTAAASSSSAAAAAAAQAPDAPDEAGAQVPGAPADAAPPAQGGKTADVAAAASAAAKECLGDLRGLSCSLVYDEEDRRGEAAGADGSDEEAGGDGGEAGGAAAAPASGRGKPKRRKASAAAGPPGEEQAAQEPTKKKRRRRGAGTGAAGSQPGADGADVSRRSQQVVQGSVDWKAVVAEFGM